MGRGGCSRRRHLGSENNIYFQPSRTAAPITLNWAFLLVRSQNQADIKPGTVDIMMRRRSTLLAIAAVCMAALVVAVVAVQWRSLQPGQATVIGGLGVLAAASLTFYGQHLNRASEEARAKTNLFEQQAAREQAHRRETARALHDRYVTAATQLAHESASVRLAGVNALRSLADDWHIFGVDEERQVCVDLLRAYLRVPARVDDVSTQLRPPMESGEGEVRRTIVHILATKANLPADDVMSWLSAVTTMSRAALNGIDLSGIDLRGANLATSDLTGASLQLTNLAGATLSHACLAGAALQGADLSAAALQGADLSRANLIGATLENANLAGASLPQALLGKARLNGAQLRDADLRGAKLGSAELTGAKMRQANFTEADLTDASVLEGSDLTYAEMVGAVLVRAKLRQAKLNGARLNGAHLQNADLRGASLISANLSGADLTDALLNGATMNDAELAQSHLVRTDLTDATLKRVDLTSAAELTQAKLPPDV
ncbi:pentapeptide repeat-containing protein [Mycolicibacterium peregrinum]|nr:pentapeptide repeat-containing protein [Mycolicibacterium peregrinum]